MRELEEETGIRATSIGSHVGQREFVLQLPDGERVVADERFFLIEANGASLYRDGWTTQEREVIADHKWWPQDELGQTSETIWPENLLTMVRAAYR